MFEFLTGSLWLHSPYSTSRMISSTYSHSHGLGSPPNYVSFVWHRLLWDTTSETHNFGCYVLQSLLLMDAHYLTENNLPNSNRTVLFSPDCFDCCPSEREESGSGAQGLNKSPIYTTLTYICIRCFLHDTFHHCCCRCWAAFPFR